MVTKTLTLIWILRRGESDILILNEEGGTSMTTTILQPVVFFESTTNPEKCLPPVAVRLHGIRNFDETCDVRTTEQTRLNILCVIGFPGPLAADIQADLREDDEQNGKMNMSSSAKRTE